MLLRHFLLAGITFFAAHQAFANCATPEFLFCSVTIGSNDELSVFRSYASATAPDSNRNSRSADGCILFHEFVNSGDTWNASRNSYAWHESMLEDANVPGAPAGMRCHLLLVSGHHDSYNSAGEYPAGYHLKRNQFVYSNQHYLYEKAFPVPSVPTSAPPAPLPAVDPGPRLLLSQLVRTAPVCNHTFNRQDYPPSGLTANSGINLLSDLLAVYLFACNFSANDGITTDVTAVRLPLSFMDASYKPEELSFSSFTFQQRAQVLFSSAVKLYTFPLTAPLGTMAAPYVINFLKNNLKRDLYNNDANFLTLYLRDLRALKQNKPPLSDIIAGGSTLQKTFAACSARTAPDCSCIRTADGSACIEQCALGADEKGKLKTKYCAGLQKFHELWDVNDAPSKKGSRRLELMRNGFLNGEATRKNEAQVSAYDFAWFF
ncbi:MAG: hypothetical protein H7301_04335 [Cryobacterium sp.]|nr:hypothetical protein [Oligoflexia bacterium]